MITVSQIREHLLDLLSSQNLASSLDEFDDWFAGASWNMHQTSDLAAQKLASAIELLLAEYESGALTEADLRREFDDLLRAYPVRVPQKVAM